MLHITDVRIYPCEHPRVHAYVTVTFENTFVVRGIRILTTREGKVLVVMPNVRSPRGTYRDICHPVSTPFRLYMEDMILKEYEHIRGNPAARGERLAEPQPEYENS